ncbi:M28 family peptidase [bacterium]|nr:M28 family peptidase [bacterium]
MKALVRGLSVFCGLAVSGTAVAASALDVGIPAQAGVIKPGKLAKLVAKDQADFALPSPGGAGDPTLGGATLTFFDTGAPGAGAASFALGAAGWSGLGNPAGSKGYKYKGAADGAGPCSVVLIKSTVIKAVCKGAAVSVTPPLAATLAVNLAIPAGTVAAVRYCAALGGSDARNDAGGLKRKDAPAPGQCAEPPGGFTGFRADDVYTLADDALAGRNNNTAGSAVAQSYLIGELQAIGAGGLNVGQLGDEAYKQHYVLSGQTGTNILAIIPGSDVPNEYVVVGAHYDHLASCRAVNVGDTVCNGATDNAAGAAAVLGIARGIAALPVAPRRSVIIALWDTEEDGLLGSQYYTNNPLVPLAATVGYINFDIQGANLLPSLRDFTFAVGAETGIGLGAIVAQAAGDVGLSGERQLSFIFGQGRSDYVNFVVKNVPTVFYSDSTGPCYHTNADEPSVVDFGKLEKQTRRGYDVAIELANTANPPVFTTPGVPLLATYGDAVILDEVLTAGLADLALFAPADQTALSNAQAAIHAIAVAGAGSFNAGSVGILLSNTVNVIDILTRTTCDGFLAP